MIRDVSYKKQIFTFNMLYIRISYNGDQKVQNLSYFITENEENKTENSSHRNNNKKYTNYKIKEAFMYHFHILYIYMKMENCNFF